MLGELITNHGESVFIVLLFWVVLTGVIFSRKKPRKERPDPPSIFGPIHGMYVCYQCDTIFNTARCPVCCEDAAIPLISLTGSVTQSEKLTAAINRLQARSTSELPVFQGSESYTSMPASEPEGANGGSYNAH
jgi:hypothetical protein